jgi:pSer/pThr/pTyr-binding forkhead associated (FHA) protein
MYLHQMPQPGKLYRRRALCHHRNVTSVESLARTAYEAHRGAHPGSLPPWEDVTEPEQEAWRVAVTAIAGQSGRTLADASPAQSLLIEAGKQRHVFHANFTAGREGILVINDEFASGHHVRFRVAHGLWYIEDLGSTNGTWLNGRRITAAQRVKKGDKIRIGHSEIIIVAT